MEVSKKELKAEAAEIRKQLKIKTLSPYTRKGLKKRYQEITDILCGFEKPAVKCAYCGTNRDVSFYQFAKQNLCDPCFQNYNH